MKRVIASSILLILSSVCHAGLFQDIEEGFAQGIAPELETLNETFYSGRCVRADAQSKVEAGGLWISYEMSSSGPLEPGTGKFGLFAETSGDASYFDHQSFWHFRQSMWVYQDSTSSAKLKGGSQTCSYGGDAFYLRKFASYYYAKGYSSLGTEFIRCYFFKKIENKP